MKFLNTLLLCTLVAATSMSVFANNSDEWELIATKTVNFHTETDAFGMIKHILCSNGTMPNG